MRASLSLTPSRHGLGFQCRLLLATTTTSVVFVSSGAGLIQQSRFTRLLGQRHLDRVLLGGGSGTSVGGGYRLLEFGLVHRWPMLYRSGATRFCGGARINVNLDGGRFARLLYSVKEEGGDDSKWGVTAMVWPDPLCWLVLPSSKFGPFGLTDFVWVRGATCESYYESLLEWVIQLDKDIKEGVLSSSIIF